VILGAQDAYYEDFGAFTGEISPAMLKDIGAQFCLTGHSERRHVLHESSDLIERKALAIYKSGMTLVHCVGEKLAERDSGKTFSVVDNQLDELKPENYGDPSGWSSRTSRSGPSARPKRDGRPGPGNAPAHPRLPRTKVERDFASRVRIQYGGSMKPENAGGLLRRNDVDGGLIGGAALKSESFLAICRAAAEAKLKKN
jgi:triosephosphate isomerase